MFTKIKHYFEDHGQACVGCTSKEIADLEKHAQGKLPQLYREFLQALGKKAGGLFVGSSFLWNELKELNGWAQETLKETGNLKLPESAFVFWMHQGYIFAFFLLDGNNDPRVYFYYEPDHPKEFKDKGQLSEFFLEEFNAWRGRHA